MTSRALSSHTVSSRSTPPFATVPPGPKSVAPAPKLKQLLRAVEQCPVAIVITDVSGRIEYVNPRFEQTTGYTRDEVIGQNPRFLKSGEQPPEFYQTLWQTITTGNEWQGEFHNRRKSGELYWERASISPITDDDGRITHFIAIKEDVTERKRMETQHRMLSGFLQNTKALVVVKDRRRRITAINDAGARLLGGCPPEAFVGRTIAEIMGLDPGVEPVRSYDEAAASAELLAPGERIEREEILEYADGTKHTHLTRYFPVFDHDGGVIGSGCISLDISDRKAAEMELIHARDAAEAASRAKSAFLANMSHELRTPLNAINGIAAMLGEAKLDEETRNAVEIIQHSGESLLTIIEEILLYSGLQAGKTRLESRAFDLLTVLMRSLQTVNPAAVAKGVSLTYWIDPAVPHSVNGDAHRLQQVLLNLLANAVKFTARGRIHLGVRCLASSGGDCRLAFSVTDTGIGVAASAIGALFRPFTQADFSVTRRFGGSGLGLAISKSLVELMGGALTLRSREGRGTSVRFVVSFRSEAAGVGIFAPLRRRELTGRRVRIVCRDPLLRNSVSGMLGAWGAVPLATTEEPLECDVLIRVESSTQGPTLRLQAGDSANHEPVALAQPVAPADLAAALVRIIAPPVRPTVQVAGPVTSRVRIGDVIPLRVLVVDDIRTNRDTARMIFRHLGYTAETAEHGVETLAKMDRATFDLIVLDLQMPIMDGFATAKEICRRLPDPAFRPKLVALSANALPGVREQCLEAGMDEYLSKPVLPQQVEACIRRLFAPNDARAAGDAPATASTTNSESPWIDVDHHDALLAGADEGSRWELLTEMHRAFESDFAAQAPKLSEACTGRDRGRTIELVHAVKGGALTLGWARLADACATTLGGLRAGTFNGWTELPGLLGAIFRESDERMKAYLCARPTAELRSAAEPKYQSCHEAI